MTCAAGLPRRERLGDRERVAQAAHDPVEQARHALALLAQLQQRPRRRALVAGDERVGERPRLALGRAGAEARSTSSTPERAPCAVLERELLQLAQQPLLAIADVRDQRPRGLRVELEAELAARADDPARQLARLDGALLRDLPAGRLDRLAQRAGTLSRPSSRPKNATVSARRRSALIAAATGSTSASFQRSTPSAITKRRPSAKVIAPSAAATASGVHASPSSSSTPPAPVSASAIARSRARRSAMRPWSSPWIR